jgi:hypothetical protein
MIDNSENQLKTKVVIPEVSRTEASNRHDTNWNYVNKKVFNLQKLYCQGRNTGYLKEAYQGLSRVWGNSQARFLGEGGPATGLSYPAGRT